MFSYILPLVQSLVGWLVLFFLNRKIRVKRHLPTTLLLNKITKNWFMLCHHWNVLQLNLCGTTGFRLIFQKFSIQYKILVSLGRNRTFMEYFIRYQKLKHLDWPLSSTFTTCLCPIQRNTTFVTTKHFHKTIIADYLLMLLLLLLLVLLLNACICVWMPTVNAYSVHRFVCHFCFYLF